MCLNLNYLLFCSQLFFTSLHNLRLVAIEIKRGEKKIFGNWKTKAIAALKLKINWLNFK